MYQPLEIEGTKELFDDVQSNPAGGDYEGLRVRLALVRDPDWKKANKPEITSSRIAYKVARDLKDDYVENILVLILNARHRVLGVYEAARGGIAGVEIHPADVLRAVLAAGTNFFILVHNHPSGDPTPSVEDRALTQRMQKAAKCVGVTMLDHLIVGLEDCVSFADRGWL